jgi:cell division septal protein FtsQ
MRKWQQRDSRRQRVKGVPFEPPAAGHFTLQKRFVQRFALVLGGGIVAALLAAQWWQQQPLKGLRVEGTRLLDSAQLVALLPLEQGASGTVRLDEWRAALLRHPFVAAASVYWDAPGIVRIQVQERRIVALYSGVPLVGIDAEGVPHRLEEPARLTGLPWVEAFSPSPEVFGEVAALLQVVPVDSVVRLRRERAGGWVLLLRDGSQLIWGDTVGSLQKWRRWSRFRSAVAGSSPLCADLRWHGLVVLRPSVQHAAEVP